MHQIAFNYLITNNLMIQLQLFVSQIFWQLLISMLIIEHKIFHLLNKTNDPSHVTIVSDCHLHVRSIFNSSYSNNRDIIVYSHIKLFSIC